jgi:dihydrofolate synthase/folylpolyglutamate synthase
MTYPQAVKYLESFVDYERTAAYPYKEPLKLERVRDFLKIVGDPQNDLKCLQIAGTKGKGSSSAFIAYILRQAGYKVGLYTSPHLSDFRERIRILIPPSIRQACLSGRQAGRQAKPNPDFEGMISKDELALLVKTFKPYIASYNKNSLYGPLTFFEIYTSLALVYFKKKKTDFAVLETGLGGRLDATNVVNSLVCAITSLSYEHTQKLGKTLKKIAAEKAGIIKSEGVAVVSAPQENEAYDVIKKRCKQIGAKLFLVGKDIKFKETDNGFSIRGIIDKYPDLKVGLLGRHQLINASVALGAIEALRLRGVDINKDSIKKGFYNTLWPGRCEIVSRKPLIVLDGAQNVASAKVLIDTIKKNFKFKKLILVLGVSQDKDINGICKVLKNFADKIILTKSANPRAADPYALAGYFQGQQIFITSSVKEALESAKAGAAGEDLILFTGSLFVVGQARELIK